MSGFIPMVSSSPPPMDDSGGFGDWDDDDDFGTFTSANDSHDFTTGSSKESPDKPAENGADVSVVNQGSGSSWNEPSQSGSTKQETHVNENIDDGIGSEQFGDFANFESYSDDSISKMTQHDDVINDKKVKVGGLDIKQTESLVGDSMATSQSGGEAVIQTSLTDSGLYSNDISPVPQSDASETCDRSHTSDTDSVSEEIQLESSDTENHPVSRESTPTENYDLTVVTQAEQKQTDHDLSVSQEDICSKSETETESVTASEVENTDRDSPSCSESKFVQSPKAVISNDSPLPDHVAGNLDSSISIPPATESSHSRSTSPDSASSITQECQEEPSHAEACSTTNTDITDTESCAVSVTNDTGTSSPLPETGTRTEEKEITFETQEDSPKEDVTEDIEEASDIPSCQTSAGDVGEDCDTAPTPVEQNMSGSNSGSFSESCPKLDDEEDDFAGPEAGPVEQLQEECPHPSTVQSDVKIVTELEKSPSENSLSQEDQLETVPGINNVDAQSSDQSDEFGDFATLTVRKSEGRDSSQEASLEGSVEDLSFRDDHADLQSVSSGSNLVSATPETVGSSSDVQTGRSEDDDDGEDDDFGDFSACREDSEDVKQTGSASEESKSGEAAEDDDDFAEFASSDVKPEEDATGDWAAFSEGPTVVADEGDDEWAAFSETPVKTPKTVEAPMVQPATPQQHLSKKERVVSAVSTCFTTPAVGKHWATTLLQDIIQTAASDTENKPTFVQDLWSLVLRRENADALLYQWAQSNWNDRLFATLQVDTRNILMGHRKTSMPIFASNLTLLEPTKGSGSASGTEPVTLIDTSRSDLPQDTNQELIPPAQFDWSSSGLTNPLEASNKTLNLDFLIQESEQGSKSNALESEFLGDSVSTMKPTIKPLQNILANMKSNSTLKQTNQTEDFSTEAARVIRSLPNLSYMHSKVLMFPLKLDN